MSDYETKEMKPNSKIYRGSNFTALAQAKDLLEEDLALFEAAKAHGTIMIKLDMKDGGTTTVIRSSERTKKIQPSG